MSDYFSSPIFDSHPSIPHLTGLDATSQEIYHGKNRDWLWEESSTPSAERQALWNSLTIFEKMTGTVLSLLVGGGTGFLVGYIIT